MRNSILTWAAAGLCVAMGAMSGCGGQATHVKGKVIRGDINFILVVDPSDERLKSEGLPDAQVAIHSGADRGGGLLGDAKSNVKGDFSIGVRDSNALMRPAEYSASLDGYSRATASMPIPPVSQRVLVILKPAPAGR